MFATCCNMFDTSCKKKHILTHVWHSLPNAATCWHMFDTCWNMFPKNATFWHTLTHFANVWHRLTHVWNILQMFATCLTHRTCCRMLTRHVATCLTHLAKCCHMFDTCWHSLAWLFDFKTHVFDDWYFKKSKKQLKNNQTNMQTFFNVFEKLSPLHQEVARVT